MESNYKPNDVVWVKLGAFWWPGEVVDKSFIPEDEAPTLKKEPIAVVRFFNEDYIECVKTRESIHPYNCDRKNSFIRKGMEAYRAQNPQMASFPKDVCLAEKKTGGNENILSDPIFTADRKRSVNITDTPRKSKDSTIKNNSSPMLSPHITHRRFLGYDDYESRIMIQTPTDEENTDPIKVSVKAPADQYTCPICKYVTESLANLITHTNCHVPTSKYILGPFNQKPQKKRRRKILSDEDLSGDEAKPKTKRKYTKKPKVTTEPQPPETTNVAEVKPPEMICKDIIADWDDESEERSEEDGTFIQTDQSFISGDDLPPEPVLADPTVDSTSEPTEPETPKQEEITIAGEKKDKDMNDVSCFDFEEDEEETKIPDATSGRKIPRVIPLSDKRKSLEIEEDEKESEENEKRRRILEESERLAAASFVEDEAAKVTEDLEKTYQSLMESSTNIEVPIIPSDAKDDCEAKTPKSTKKGTGQKGRGGKSRRWQQFKKAESASTESDEPDELVLPEKQKAEEKGASEPPKKTNDPLDKKADVETKVDASPTVEDAATPHGRQLRSSRTSLSVRKTIEFEKAKSSPRRGKGRSTNKETRPKRTEAELDALFNQLLQNPIQETSSNLDSNDEQAMSEEEKPIKNVEVLRSPKSRRRKSERKEEARDEVEDLLADSGDLTKPSVEVAEQLSGVSPIEKEVDNKIQEIDKLIKTTQETTKEVEQIVSTEANIEHSDTIEETMSQLMSEKSVAPECDSTMTDTSVIQTKETDDTSVCVDKTSINEESTEDASQLSENSPPFSPLHDTAVEESKTTDINIDANHSPKNKEVNENNDNNDSRLIEILAQEEEVEAEEIPLQAVEIPKRTKKPSRWDQKEKTTSVKEKKTLKTRWDQTNKQEPQPEVEKKQHKSRWDQIPTEEETTIEEPPKPEEGVQEPIGQQFLMEITGDDQQKDTETKSIEPEQVITEIINEPENVELKNIETEIVEQEKIVEPEQVANIVSEKSSSIDDKTKLVLEQPKIDKESEIKQEQSIQTSKLINPKKRFVKSFEDAELIRQKENSAKVLDEAAAPIAFKIKNQYLSKIASEHEAEVSKSPIEEPVAGPSIELPPKTTSANDVLNDLSSLFDIPILQTDVPKSQDVADDSKTTIITKNFPLEATKEEEQPELVPIDGNLTVVSEKELAEGQVEITASMAGKKPVSYPVSLSNFSMDFSDDSGDNSFEIFKKEKFQQITQSLETPTVSEKSIPAETVTKKSIEKTFESIITDQLNLQTTSAIEGERKPIRFNIENKKLELGSLSKRNSPPKDFFDIENDKKQVHVNVEPKKVEQESRPQFSGLNALLSAKITEKPKLDITPPAPTKKFVRKSTTNILPQTTKAELNEPVVIYNTAKTSAITEMCDLEDHIPSQIVCTKDALIDQEARKTIPFVKDADVKVDLQNLKLDPMAAKNLIKTAIKSKNVPRPGFPKTSNKINVSSNILVRPPVNVKNFEDSEDAKTFVIQKSQKINETIKTTPKVTMRSTVNTPRILKQMPVTPKLSSNKPRILNQTIIRPANDVLTPKVTEESMDFDINSMPIVLSDELIVPQTTIDSSVVSNDTPRLQSTIKPMVKSSEVVTTPMKSGSKFLQTQKIIRHTVPSSSSTSSKAGKYVIMSDSPNKLVQVVKKPPVVKRTIPSTSSDGSGNKVMILTNQQGKQQRLLLTPAHQKIFNMHSKSQMKTIIQKQQTLSSGKISHLTPQKLIQKSSTETPGMARSQKVYASASSSKIPQQKTIIIKNQHGQTVRKMQGTDQALLERQVAEQIEAIKAQSTMKQRQLEMNTRPVNKHITPTSKPRSYKPPSAKLSAPEIPPLSPIVTEKKIETEEHQKPIEPPKAQPKDRPLNQLVIQDNMGNQTTVTEGQILALPSETVDGQPQSYMLVTLDESGNLTPLNNEALMSLDPNLVGLSGSDISNMVLQMEPPAPVKEVVEPTPKPVTAPPTPATPAEVQVACNINGESGQQQILLTGDPLATKKFLDTLTEGNTDLANILASADGNSSFLIQAEGQQILINTEPSTSGAIQENVADGQGNPLFAISKNQDILAAALADTDVFQQEAAAQSKSLQLSPGQMYPMNVSNVLDTTLTLSAPIMTPLVVPSTNSKKIPDEEADILTSHVAKNVDLPITITDPNISQTVSQQQVLLSGDLQTNLELSLPMSESVTSGMSSPSFVYSLPNLEQDIGQKNFSGSMPLLTEDMDDANASSRAEEKSMGKSSPTHDRGFILSRKKTNFMTDSFIGEGLCTLGGEMCSSLSEPPPEMFDMSLPNESFLSSKVIREPVQKEEDNSTGAEKTL